MTIFVFDDVLVMLMLKVFCLYFDASSSCLHIAIGSLLIELVDSVVYLHHLLFK